MKMEKKGSFQKEFHSRRAIIVTGIILFISYFFIFFIFFFIFEFKLVEALYEAFFYLATPIALIYTINKVIKSIRLSFYGRKGINLFISHSIENFTNFKIKEISEYLKKNKFIKKVIYCESDAYDAGIRGDIEDWMDNTVPLCQILLFIATESSISSKSCAHELQLALESNIDIISVVDDKLSLERLVQMNDISFTFRNRQIDLSGLDLDRKSRINFSNDITELTEALNKAIIVIKEKIDDMLKELKKKRISDITMLEKQLNITTTEIEKTIRILIKINKMKGAWTTDKRYFLTEKEVLHRLKLTKKLRKFENNSKLIEAAGFHNDSIEDVKNILEKKNVWSKLFVREYSSKEKLYRYLNRRIKINIFISHPLENFDNYEIKEISKYLKGNKAVKKVIYNKINRKRRGIHEEMEEWSKNKIPLCQTFLFIATKNSMISRQCAYELHIAQEDDIAIIPVVDNKIEWEELDQMNDMKFVFRNRNIDLSGLDLSRKIGVNYRSDYIIVAEELLREIGKFTISLEMVLQKLYESSISNISILEKQLNINVREIEKIIRILMKIKKINGAWTEDKNNFLTKKGVRRQLISTKRQTKFKNDEQVIKAAGFHEDSFEVVKKFQKSKAKMIRNSLLYILIIFFASFFIQYWIR